MYNSNKLRNAIKVIECEIENKNPCEVLDLEDVQKAYQNILNTLKSLKTEGYVKWYHYFDDREIELEPEEL